MLLVLLVTVAPVVTFAAEAETSAEFVAGLAAIEDGLYSIAERQFTAFLDREEDLPARNAEAALWLAQALYEQEKYSEILDWVKPRRSWVKKAPDPGAFIFWRAVALYRLGDEAKSKAAVEELQQSCPGSEYLGRAERLKAWSELKRGNIDAAAAAFARFDKVVKEPREVAANLLEWSKALISAGRLDEARVTLERLSQLPENLRSVQDGLFWYGQLLSQRQEWGATLQVLQRLGENAKADPDIAGQAYFAQATVYESMTNFSSAATAVSNGILRARSLDIQQLGQARLGHIWLCQGRVEEGIPLIKQYVAAHPLAASAAAFQMEIGQKMLDLGKNKEAVAEFQLYLETFTNIQGLAEAHMGKGWALFGCERFAEAAASFARAFEMSHESELKALALMKAADALLANGQFAAAASTYGRIGQEFPKSELVARAGLQQGHALVRGGSSEEAERLFVALGKAHEGTPTGEEACLRLVRLREERGKFKEAMEGYGQLLSVYSNGIFTAEARVGRGTLQYRHFLSADALKDFDVVVARYPESEAAERALFMKGLCHFRMMQDKEMLGVFRTFQARYPESRWLPDVLFWLGKYEYNQEQFEAAEKQFLVLVEKYKDSALVEPALLRAGSAAMKRKEYVRAVEILTRLAKEHPKSALMVEARFAQAEALSLLGKYADAILVLDEIRNGYPTHSIVPAVWMRKGDCQFMLGSEDPKRYAGALTSYAVVASDPVVAREQPDLVFEAEYKIGKCYEKQDKIDDALDQYYTKVVIRFLRERDRNVRHTETGKMWFTRAAFNAADILEARKDWRRVVNVLERVIDAGIPAGKDTRDRIRKIRNDYYWLFYGD